MLLHRKQSQIFYEAVWSVYEVRGALIQQQNLKDIEKYFEVILKVLNSVCENEQQKVH